MAARWRGTTSIQGTERTLGDMSAEPVRDEAPSDPAVILRDLPEQERAEFLRQYHEAVEAARDPAGYGQLRRLLHTWRLIAIATSQPGYYEALQPYETASRERHQPRKLSRTGRSDWRRTGTAAVTYRAQLHDRVLGQLGNFPVEAFDALIAVMAAVVEYPADRCGRYRRATHMCVAPSSVGWDWSRT